MAASKREYRVLLMVFCASASLVLFNLVPAGAVKPLFPFSDQMLTLQTWSYFAGEYVAHMCFITALSYAVPSLRPELRIFLWLEVLATADYVLRYGENLYGDFDFNTAKLCLYGGVIGRKIIKNYGGIRTTQ